MNIRQISILLLVVILVVILNLFLFKSKEHFQTSYSIDINSQNKMAVLKNINNVANIPGIKSKIHTDNKCKKWSAYESCDSKDHSSSNDLNCQNTITGTQAGYCDCSKKNVYFSCDEYRKNFTCEEVCETQDPPQSLEFNGNSSMVLLKYLYNKNQGFTISFYIKKSEFISYPLKNQVLMKAFYEDNTPAFVLFLNKNSNICFYSYLTKKNICVTSQKIDNNWHFIAFGNHKNKQFIQIDGENQKHIDGINLDKNDNKTESTLQLYVGGHEELSEPYRFYKGLLGAIKIHKKFLSSNDLCSNNKYCNEQELPGINDNRCMFLPKGNTPLSCVKECKRNMNNNNCNIDQCLAKCELCDDSSLCKWKQKKSVCDIRKRPQPVVEDSDTCNFVPWGVDEKHCISECQTGDDKETYGGDLCSQDACTKICRSCPENDKHCSWKKLVVVEKKHRPKAPKNLIGMPKNNEIILRWDYNKFEDIDKFKIVYYKEGVDSEFYYKEKDTTNLDESTHLSIDRLENNQSYICGVVSINNQGASPLSNLVRVKPNANVEGFTSQRDHFQSNVTHSPPKRCTFFEALKGKTFDISF